MAGLNNWLDSAGYSLGSGAAAFDSMFFNLADSLSLGFSDTTTGSAGDQLVLTDSAIALLSGALVFGDSLSFADGFAAQLLSENSFGDQMFFSDLAGLQLSVGLLFTDSLSLTDFVNNSSSDQLLVSVMDSLYFWDDSFASQSSTGETTYLRQYLNDVIN